MVTKAVTVAEQELSPAELTAFLQKAGYASAPSGDRIPRMSLTNGRLVTDDGEMFVYNPSKPRIPALVARIVKPLEEYWAIYLSDTNAGLIGRPELGNSFSKKYITPDDSRRLWESDLAFDDIKSYPGLVDNFGKPLKPSWKGDLLLQIVPESGKLTGEEPIYVLTLSTTSVIEFKGASKAPEKGVVSDFNFIQKLCQYAMDACTDRSKEALQKAITGALTSYTMGGVVAEVRILPAENKDMGTTWSIVSFDPIHVEPFFENDLLADGTDEDGQ
jgi:hypothetical protein